LTFAFCWPLIFDSLWCDARYVIYILQIMAEQSVIVWDLETVPDLAAAARMLDLGDAPEAKVREELWFGFS